MNLQSQNVGIYIFSISPNQPTRIPPWKRKFVLNLGLDVDVGEVDVDEVDVDEVDVDEVDVDEVDVDEVDVDVVDVM